MVRSRRGPGKTARRQSSRRTKSAAPADTGLDPGSACPDRALWTLTPGVFTPGTRDPNRSRGQALAWQGDVTQRTSRSWARLSTPLFTLFFVFISLSFANFHKPFCAIKPSISKLFNSLLYLLSHDSLLLSLKSPVFCFFGWDSSFLESLDSFQHSAKFFGAHLFRSTAIH